MTIRAATHKSTEGSSFMASDESRSRRGGRRAPPRPAIPGAMKLWPMPRARMKVSAPRLDLLVLRHGVEERVDGAVPARHVGRAASAGRPCADGAATRAGVLRRSRGRAAPRSGRPAQGRWRRPRHARGGRRRSPSRRSSAWPKVWPRLSSARSPSSRSSRSDDRRLRPAGLRATASSRAGLAGEDAAPVRLAPVEKNAASSIRPYFTTSA